MKSLPKVKSLTLAVGLALGLSAGVANAEIVNAGPLTAVQYTNSFSAATGTSFIDIINFSITTPSVLSATAINVYLPVLGLDISGLTGALFDSSNQQIGLFSSPTSAFSTNLGVGDYHFDFSGTATGVMGGAYTVSLGAVAPVPEPGTYAMFLAALGLIGAITVRNKKNL